MGAQLHRPEWPPTLLTSVSSPSGGLAGAMGPKASTPNHTVRVLVWPMALRHSDQT